MPIQKGIADLPPKAKETVEELKAKAELGKIGGGYNSAAAIPAQEGSKYSQLSEADRAIIDRVIDKSRSDAIADDKNKLFKPGSAMVTKEGTEQSVHIVREAFAPTVEALKAAEKAGESVKKTQKPSPAK